MKLATLSFIILLTSSSLGTILKHHSLIQKSKTNEFEDLIENIIGNKFHSSNLLNNIKKEEQISDGSPLERGLMEIQQPNPSILNNQQPHKVKKAIASKKYNF